jgi:parallel beta-helix repeat protein
MISLISKKRLLTILLPIMLMISLMAFGSVFADDGTAPEAGTGTTAESPSGGEISSDDENLPMQADTADSTDDSRDETSANEHPDENTDSSTSDDRLENEGTSQDEILDEIDDDTGEPDTSLDEGSTSMESDEVIADNSETETGDDQSENSGDVASELAESDLTVVDENGDEVDTTNESSAEIISSADPWWIVNGVKYAYVKTGGTCPSDATYCYESDTPIRSALTYMDENGLIPSDGILHIEADSYTEDISVDGSSGYGNLSALKGIVSSGTSSDTTITGTIIISNTTSGFTLIGMTIIGQLEITGNIGTITLTDVTVESSSGTGITITDQNGAVTVDQVKADNNSAYGMYVDNTAGNGAVTITNSEFSHNDDSISSTNYSGLYINSNGVITLDGVTASANAGSGAELTSSKGIVVGNSLFSGNFTESLDEDYGYGLYINNTSTTAYVTLENVQADKNELSGIYVVTGGNIVLESVSTYSNGLDYDYGGIHLDNTSGKGSVSVSDSQFSTNGDNGLEVYSSKNISLDSVSAEDNDGDGVYLDNCIYDAASGTCLGNGIVSIAGNSVNSFNDNGGTGLYILSASNVTLMNFTADNNHYGIYIKNNYTGKSGMVTIKQTYTSDLEDFANSVSNNTLNGIQIYSNGNISIQDLTIANNGADGAILDNSTGKSKSVSLRAVDATGNGGDGIQISTNGAVTLYSVNSYSNSANGLYILASDSTKTISFTGARSFTANYTNNGGYGIYILSSGIINLRGVDASGNGYGAYIDNSNGSNKAVNISSADFSDSTLGTGLAVTSNGAIVLKNVTSDSNALNGMVLDNTSSTKKQNVKVYNTTASSNTNGSGILIESTGMVILSALQANINTGTTGVGVSIDNCQYDSDLGACTYTAGIKVIGSDNQFNQNTLDGLLITTNGAIVLTNLTADDNGNNGLMIDNTYDSSKVSVKLSTSSGYTNSFSGNGNYGVYITIPGSITLSKLEANENAAKGLYLESTGSSITLTSTTASNNSRTGLHIDDAVKVTLKDVITSSNGQYGTYISSDSDVTILTATRGGTGLKANYNVSSGLYIVTDGNISISDVVADNNGDNGAYLDNTYAAGKGISLSNANFDNNGYDGVVIETTGSVTWKSGSASENDSGNGASVDNTDTTASISISGVNFDGNNGYGLYVNSLGDIDLKSVTANNNTGTAGAFLDNCQENGVTGTCDGSGNITVQGSYGEDVFGGNSDIGLLAYSFGNITVINVNANNNGGIGLVLYNPYSGSTGTITVKATSKNYLTEVSNNGSDGVQIDTNGAVYVGNISADGNTGYGIKINNTTSTNADGVTMTRIQNDGNGNNGLYVVTNGDISLSYAVDYTDGIYLNNSSASSARDVTVTRSKFDGVTAGNGLEVVTKGDVILDNLTATNNKNGVVVDNSAGSGATVKLTNKIGESAFSNNTQNGLLIVSTGDVSLSGLTAEANGTDGVSISTSGSLLVSDALLNRNGGAGIYATANEGITLFKVRSVFNGSLSNGDGVTLTVASGSDVKISYSVFNGNYGSGIDITGDASPELYKTTYFGNDMDNSGDANLDY